MNCEDSVPVLEGHGRQKGLRRQAQVVSSQLSSLTPDSALDLADLGFCPWWQGSCRVATDKPCSF